MTDLEDQREADFGSLVNLCGWDAEPDLEKDFWVFVIVVFYLGTKLEKANAIFTGVAISNDYFVCVRMFVLCPILQLPR